jgi:hypothetical protein
VCKQDIRLASKTRTQGRRVGADATRPLALPANAGRKTLIASLGADIADAPTAVVEVQGQFSVGGPITLCTLNIDSPTQVLRYEDYGDALLGEIYAFAVNGEPTLCLLEVIFVQPWETIE